MIFWHPVSADWTEPQVETHHKAMIDIFLVLIIRSSALLIIVKQADVFVVTVTGILLSRTIITTILRFSFLSFPIHFPY